MPNVVQNRRVENEYSARYLLRDGFLFGLFCAPEDGGDMFLRNVDCRRTTRRYIPEDRTLQYFDYFQSYSSAYKIIFSYAFIVN
jgi:hypothetical protein